MIDWLGFCVGGGGRNWLGFAWGPQFAWFSVSIEIDLVFVWVVDIDLISM